MPDTCLRKYKAAAPNDFSVFPQNGQILFKTSRGYSSIAFVIKNDVRSEALDQYRLGNDISAILHNESAKHSH